MQILRDLVPYKGVVDARGRLVSVHRTAEDAAIAAAEQVGPGRVSAPTAAALSMPSRASVGRAMRANPGLPVVRDAPYEAMQACGLPRIDFREVMRLSLEEAYDGTEGGKPTIRQILPQLWQEGKARVLKGPPKPGLWAREPVSKVVQKLLRSNFKMAKGLTASPAQQRLLDGLGIPKDIEVNVVGLPFTPANGAKLLASIDPYPRPGAWRPGRDFDVCKNASPECMAACLSFSGQYAAGAQDWEGFYGGPGREPITTYNVGIRYRMLQALMTHPERFMRLVVAACERLAQAPKPGLFNYVRLNVLSDIPWELVCPGLFDHFDLRGPRPLMFYDYTKVPGRRPPPNYHLTFSFSGQNAAECEWARANGQNVTVVFLPSAEGGRGAHEEQWWHGAKTFPEVYVSEKTGKAGKTQPVPLPRWGSFLTVPGDLYDSRPLDDYALAHHNEDFAFVTLTYKVPLKPKGGGAVMPQRKWLFVVDIWHSSSTGQWVAAHTPTHENLLPGALRTDAAE